MSTKARDDVLLQIGPQTGLISSHIFPLSDALQRYCDLAIDSLLYCCNTLY